MKKMLFALFILIASASYISAQDTTNESASLLGFEWFSDENYLFLEITTVDGLSFQNTYFVRKLNDSKWIAADNGWGCDLVIEPAPGYEFYSEEGIPLIKIKLTVDVQNTDLTNKVDYRITVEHVYGRLLDLSPLPSITIPGAWTSDLFSGSLVNPSIKLGTYPIFFDPDNSQNLGVIEFTNTFPYSQIQQ